MMGSDPHSPLQQHENSGLYVLAGKEIFATIEQQRLQHIEVQVSCFEIYGGKLFDLLNSRSPIKCLEDSKQQVRLPGLTHHPVCCVEDLLDLMAKAHSQRSTGSTGANNESSRSHQIMQLVLKDQRKAKKKTEWNEGKLSFIDLAGSERGADTTHSSKQTRLEGAEINTSLLALKEVIRSLEKKHGHTPFRGSKLTQVLKDSFVGEKSRTCMLACVSPAHSNCEHTLNTLRYADRVKEHSATVSGPTMETQAVLSPELPEKIQEKVAEIRVDRLSIGNRSETGPRLRTPLSPEKLTPTHSPQLRALFPSREKENLAFPTSPRYVKDENWYFSRSMYVLCMQQLHSFCGKAIYISASSFSRNRIG
jgi:hypothetical protein